MQGIDYWYLPSVRVTTLIYVLSNYCGKISPEPTFTLSSLVMKGLLLVNLRLSNVFEEGALQTTTFK